MIVFVIDVIKKGAQLINKPSSSIQNVIFEEGCCSREQNISNADNTDCFPVQ